MINNCNAQLIIYFLGVVVIRAMLDRSHVFLLGDQLLLAVRTSVLEEKFQLV
jgi:hypothetical protein